MKPPELPLRLPWKILANAWPVWLFAVQESTDELKLRAILRLSHKSAVNHFEEAENDFYVFTKPVGLVLLSFLGFSSQLNRKKKTTFLGIESSRFL